MIKKNRKKIAALGAAVVVLGGFAYLLYGGIGNSLVYFLTPSELTAKGEKVYGAPVRLGGQIVPGSVVWKAETIDLRFKMTDGKQTVAVHSTKAPPQMFRDGMGVVVEGKLARNGVFESNNLMVKHSNEYKPPHAGQKPEDMYKTLIRESRS
jgi:cytochrome c-type biogenesis protein CcmE